jgi:hypothetical protein
MASAACSSLAVARSASASNPFDEVGGGWAGRDFAGGCNIRKVAEANHGLAVLRATGPVISAEKKAAAGLGGHFVDEVQALRAGV